MVVTSMFIIIWKSFPYKPRAFLLIQEICFWKNRWTNSWTSRLQPTCHSWSSGFLVFFIHHIVTNEELAQGPTKFPFTAAPLLQLIFASLLFLSDFAWNWDEQKPTSVLTKKCRTAAGTDDWGDAKKQSTLAHQTDTVYNQNSEGKWALWCSQNFSEHWIEFLKMQHIMVSLHGTAA